MTTSRPTKATAKPAKPAKPPKPAGKRNRTTKRKAPSQGEIAQRAYFIHLDGGAHDQLANWLQAERELTRA
jgi:hypothetical protein